MLAQDTELKLPVPGIWIWMGGAGLILELLLLWATYHSSGHWIVLLVAGAFAAGVALYNPFWGFLLAIFVEFSGIVWGFSIPFGFFSVVAITALGWVFDVFGRMKFSIRFDFQLIWMFALLGAVLFASLDAFNLRVSLGKVLSYSKLLFFYFLILQIVRTPKQLGLIFWAMVYAMLFTIAVGILGVFFPLPILGTVEQGFRFRGLMNDPNVLALHVLIIFPIIALFVFHVRSNVKRYALVFLLILLFFVLLATFSRGATLGFGAIVLGLLYVLRRNRALLAFALAALIIGILLVPGIFWERLSSLSDIYRDPSLRWRVKLFFGALHLFLKHPFNGIGAGNFVLISHQFVAMHLAVHNTWLEVATEMGVPGFILFTGIFATYLLQLRRAAQMFARSGRRDLEFISKGLLVSSLGIFVYASFHSIEEYFVLWTLFGLGSALYHASKSGEAGRE